MDQHEWIPKADVASLFGVSTKTIQRKIGTLDPSFVKRENKRVFVSRRAISLGLLGKTWDQLNDENDVLQTTVDVLGETLETEKRLRLEDQLAAEQRRTAELEVRLAEVSQERDRLLAAFAALGTPPTKA